MTDVYSFGVLIFEVFSFAEFPYDAIYEDAKFIQFLTDESGSALPLHAELVFTPYNVRDPPKRVMQLMAECVSRHPSNRPTFAAIADCTAKPKVAGPRARLRTSSASAGNGGGGGRGGSAGGGAAGEGGSGVGDQVRGSPDGYLDIGGSAQASESGL